MALGMRLAIPVVMCLLELLQPEAAPLGKMSSNDGLALNARLQHRSMNPVSNRQEGDSASNTGPHLYVAYATSEEGWGALMASWSGPGRRARSGDGKASAILMKSSEAQQLAGKAGVGAVELLTPEMKLSHSALNAVAARRAASGEASGSGEVSSRGASSMSAARKAAYGPDAVHPTSSRNLKGMAAGGTERLVVLVAVGDATASDLAAEWGSGLGVVGVCGAAGEVSARSPDEATVIAEVPRGCTAEAVEWLAAQQLSTWVEVPGKFSVRNQHLSSVLQGGAQSLPAPTTPVHDKGIRGDKEIIGIADTGIDYDSVFFRDPDAPVPPLCVSDAQSGKIQSDNCAASYHRKIARYRYFKGNTASDSSTPGDGQYGNSPNGHGTHLTGTALGSAVVPGNSSLQEAASKYNGVAPEARVAFDDVHSEAGNNDYLNAVPDDIGSGLLKPTYDLGARIYSISWGTEDNTYTTTSASIDKFVAENDDLLVLVAAGNDGEGKYGPVSFTVGSPATAKNILAVGSSWNSLNAALEYSTGDPSGLGLDRRLIPAPVSIDSTIYQPWYVHFPAEFGPGLASSTSLKLVMATPAQGCGQPASMSQSVLTNAAECVGKAVIIDRGSCYFVDKVRAAQAAGAKYVIVAQYQSPVDERDVAPRPLVMNAPSEYGNATLSPYVGISAVMVSYSDAVELKSLADRGGWIKFWDFEHQLSSFSARGPVMNKGSEMRMKPDVICPGEEVMSARSDGNLSSSFPQAATALMSGTSMATPACAGAAALVRQYLREGWHVTGSKDTASGLVSPSAALLKAFLIHSARPIRYQTTTGLAWVAPYEGAYGFRPTRDIGYGLIDLSSVLTFSSARKIFIKDRAVISQGGTPQAVCVSVKSDAERLRATLVWTDPQGDPSRPFSLVNDLDLVVRSNQSGRLYYGNNFTSVSDGGARDMRDSVNNVEQVTIDVPGTPSVWGIYVRPQFYWGASPQKYSLVVTGSFDIVACPTYSDDLLCPNACSGYGKCTRSGACVCDAKHFGEDCSLSMAVLYRDAQVNFNAASESWVYYSLTIVKKGDAFLSYTGTSDPDFYIGSKGLFPTVDQRDIAFYDARQGGELQKVNLYFQPVLLEPGDYVVGVLPFCCYASAGYLKATGTGVLANPNAVPSPTPSPTPAPPTPAPSPYTTPSGSGGGGRNPPPPSPSPTPARTPRPAGAFLGWGTLDFRPYNGLPTIVGSVDFKFQLSGIQDNILPASAKFSMVLPGFSYDSTGDFKWSKDGYSYRVEWTAQTATLTLRYNAMSVSGLNDVATLISIPSEANLRLPASGLALNDASIKVGFSIGTSAADAVTWLPSNALKSNSLDPLPPAVVVVPMSSKVSLGVGLSGRVDFPVGMFGRENVRATLQAVKLDAKASKTDWGQSGSDLITITMEEKPRSAFSMVVSVPPIGGSRRSVAGTEATTDWTRAMAGGAPGDLPVARAATDGKDRVLKLMKQINNGGWVMLDSGYSPSCMCVTGKVTPADYDKGVVASYDASGNGNGNNSRTISYTGKFCAFWMSLSDFSASAGSSTASISPSSPSSNSGPTTPTSGPPDVQGIVLLVVYIALPITVMAALILGLIRRRQLARRLEAPIVAEESPGIELSTQATIATALPTDYQGPTAAVGLLVRHFEGIFQPNGEAAPSPTAPPFPRECGSPRSPSAPPLPSAPPAPAGGYTPIALPPMRPSIQSSFLFARGADFRLGANDCVDVPAVVPIGEAVPIVTHVRTSAVPYPDFEPGSVTNPSAPRMAEPESRVRAAAGLEAGDDGAFHM